VANTSVYPARRRSVAPYPILIKHTYLLIATVPIAAQPPIVNLPEVTPEKVSTPTVQLLVLNSGVTNLNLTKFLQDIQK